MPTCRKSSQVLNRAHLKKSNRLSKPTQIRMSNLVCRLQNAEVDKQEVEDQEIKELRGQRDWFRSPNQEILGQRS